jgi:hypothetical protein
MDTIDLTDEVIEQISESELRLLINRLQQTITEVLAS